jgi:hypothetical protein
MLKKLVMLTAAFLVALPMAATPVLAAPAEAGSPLYASRADEDRFFDFQVWYWHENHGWVHFGQYDMRSQAEWAATILESYGFAVKIVRVTDYWWHDSITTAVFTSSFFFPFTRRS